MVKTEKDKINEELKGYTIKEIFDRISKWNINKWKSWEETKASKLKWISQDNVEKVFQSSEQKHKDFIKRLKDMLTTWHIELPTLGLILSEIDKLEKEQNQND